MKVSWNTVKHLSNVDLSDIAVDDVVQKIGAQLGAVETVERTGAKYDGVIVAKVVSCEKHPNADKLSVCWVDDGGVAENVERNEDGHVQVVCGAPNVRAGLTVAWLPPGSTVPSTYGKDPFVLGARELRGVVSNGMLASPSELAISDDHSGILEIDPQDVGDDLTAPGTPFKKLYGLDDVIIEIENKMFTHRPDCFGVLGVAREIAGIYGRTFTSPEWYLNAPVFNEASDVALEIENEIPELCPRFMAVAMKDVTIKQSPVWMQALLTRVGIRPISNVVDITNYLSYITAQPLHAYDYDKVAARSNANARLIIRKPRDGETIALLNGKTITPRADAIMIATDKELVGVGGVMGGTTTEVDENTKNIIIEVANFDMYSIRRTSMAHGLFTDAVTRFNKGQSPLQTDRIIAEAMKMVRELADAHQASSVIDNKHLPENFHKSGYTVHGPVDIDPKFVNARLGLNLSDKEVCRLLNNVEFDAHPAAGPLCVTAPFWRTDIAIPEDIVEEVGRLLGFDKLPLELPKRTVTPTVRDEYLSLKQAVRQKLASLGANEVLTYSFVHGKLLEKVGQNTELAFKLTNALSPELQYYRLSMTPSLLDKIHGNVKAGHDEFALYELGKVHSKSEIDNDEQVPNEFGRLGFVYASRNSKSPAFYTAKQYLMTCRSDMQLVPFDIELLKGHELMNQMMSPYDPARSAMVMHENGYVVGVVGEFRNEVIRAFKLPHACAGFELFLSACAPYNSGYQPLSRFPSVTQDICLEVPLDTTFGELSECFETALTHYVEPQQAVHTEPIDIFTSQDIGNKKRITFRVRLTSYERTLSDSVVSHLLQKVTDDIGQKIHITRI